MTTDRDNHARLNAVCVSLVSAAMTVLIGTQLANGLLPPML